MTRQLDIPDARSIALAQAVEYIYGARVDGDLIEFGVKSGESAGVLLGAMKFFEQAEANYPKDRKLWLCDSFEGFPKTDNSIDRESYMVKSGVWGPGMSRGCSADQLRQMLGDKLARCEIVEGWFIETKSRFAGTNLMGPVRQYALIHADCDLYESTMDALVPLFERGAIMPGCIILFDDWNGNQARKEFGQRRAWADLDDRFYIEASDEGGYGAYSHKFIVHGYEGMA